jgi:hypothetical protein
MFAIRTILGLALPVILSAIGLALAWRKRTGAEPSRRGIAAGIGTGFLAGSIALGWPPPFPPMDVADRTPWLALAATIFASLAPGASRIQRGGLALLAALVSVAILGPVLPETSGTRAGLAWLVVVGLVVLVAWANVEWLAERLEGAAPIWSMLMVAGGTSVVLIASHSAVLCLLGLALTSALAAPAIASWRWALGGSVRGAVPIFLAVVTALILNGHVYADVPTSSAVALAAAPAGAWAARLGPARRGAPWRATLAAVVATLLPIGAAVGLALSAATSYE